MLLTSSLQSVGGSCISPSLLFCFTFYASSPVTSWFCFLVGKSLHNSTLSKLCTYTERVVEKRISYRQYCYFFSPGKQIGAVAAFSPFRSHSSCSVARHPELRNESRGLRFCYTFYTTGTKAQNSGYIFFVKRRNEPEFYPAFRFAFAFKLRLPTVSGITREPNHRPRLCTSHSRSTSALRSGHLGRPHARRNDGDCARGMTV